MKVYVGILELDYQLLSVGSTEEEAKNNMIKNFTEWTKQHPYAGNVEKWVSNVAGENFEDYNNDVWEFLISYYGCNIQEIDDYGVVS